MEKKRLRDCPAMRRIKSGRVVRPDSGVTQARRRPLRPFVQRPLVVIEECAEEKQGNCFGDGVFNKPLPRSPPPCQSPPPTEEDGLATLELPRAEVLDSGSESELENLEEEEEEDGLSGEDVIVLPEDPKPDPLDGLSEPKPPQQRLCVVKKASGELELVPTEELPLKQLQDKQEQWAAAKEVLLESIRQGLHSTEPHKEAGLKWLLSLGLAGHLDQGDWNLHVDDILALNPDPTAAKPSLEERQGKDQNTGCFVALRKKLFRDRSRKAKLAAGEKVKEKEGQRLKAGVQQDHLKEALAWAEQLSERCREHQEEMLERRVESWDRRVGEKLARDRALIAEKSNDNPHYFSPVCWINEEQKVKPSLSETDEDTSVVPVTIADQPTLVLPVASDDLSTDTDVVTVEVDPLSVLMAGPAVLPPLNRGRRILLPPVTNLSPAAQKLLEKTKKEEAIRDERNRLRTLERALAKQPMRVENQVTQTLVEIFQEEQSVKEDQRAAPKNLMRRLLQWLRAKLGRKAE